MLIQIFMKLIGIIAVIIIIYLLHISKEVFNKNNKRTEIHSHYPNVKILYDEDELKFSEKAGIDTNNEDWINRGEEMEYIKFCRNVKL